jgi:hypothetical protein
VSNGVLRSLARTREGPEANPQPFGLDLLESLYTRLSPAS